MRERGRRWGKNIQKVKARVRNRWAVRNFCGVYEQTFDLQHSHSFVCVVLKRKNRFDVQCGVKPRRKGETGLRKRDQSGS